MALDLQQPPAVLACRAGRAARARQPESERAARRAPYRTADHRQRQVGSPIERACAAVRCRRCRCARCCASSACRCRCTGRRRLPRRARRGRDRADRALRVARGAGTVHRRCRGAPDYHQQLLYARQLGGDDGAVGIVELLAAARNFQIGAPVRSSVPRGRTSRTAGRARRVPEPKDSMRQLSARSPSRRVSALDAALARWSRCCAIASTSSLRQDRGFVTQQRFAAR